jgi:tRNA(Ile2) C34 agmatinyltransferase TiaS
VTTELQKLQCPACEGTLDLKDEEYYVCKKCGEVFNLRGLSQMELNLEEFDRLLQYTLKKSAAVKTRNEKSQAWA